MKKRVVILVIGIILALGVPSIFFYINFKNQLLSENIDDWSSFGSYMAGTVGTIFSISAVVLVYLTYLTQKEQQFESTYNQLMGTYNNVLNLIKEKWLMFDTPGVEYLTGREIFGCAANYLYHENSELNNLEQRFNKMFQTHINVFGHYTNFILELIDVVQNRSDLSEERSTSVLRRFSSQMSFYELVFLGYYSLYYLKNSNAELHTTFLLNFLFWIKMDNTSEIQHNQIVNHLIGELWSNDR